MRKKLTLSLAMMLMLMSLFMSVTVCADSETAFYDTEYEYSESSSGTTSDSSFKGNIAIVTGVIGFVAGTGVSFFIICGSYKVRKKSEAGEYLDKTSVLFTQKTDTLISDRTTKELIQSND